MCDARNPTGAISVGARGQFRVRSDAAWRNGKIVGECPDQPDSWLVKVHGDREPYSVPWYAIRLIYIDGTGSAETEQWLACYGDAAALPEGFTPPPAPFVRVRPLNDAQEAH